MNTIRRIEAAAAHDIEVVRTLFIEYARSLDFSLCFQSFEEELATLPGKYAAPRGALLLAERAGQPAGCVALREIGPDVCEMKRLYLRPAFRGHGLGRALAEAIIAEARRIGYAAMRLDTVASRMREAISLYESLGFRRTEAYCHNPQPDVVFMELALRQVENAMSQEERPPRPHPDCIWDEKNKIWRWPDDRTSEQRQADDLAAELGESGAWEEHGFRRKHTARINRAG